MGQKKFFCVKEIKIKWCRKYEMFFKIANNLRWRK